MKQAYLGLNLAIKRTRKREFLAQMERVVPWAHLVASADAARVICFMRHIVAATPINFKTDYYEAGDLFSVSLVVEFNTKEACEKALAEVKPMTPVLAERGGSSKRPPSAVCVEKGKP
jgi:hypothetical protein